MRVEPVQDEFEEIISEVKSISSEVFELIRDRKFKESSEKLESAFFKMAKLLYIRPKDIERAKKELREISQKFEILKRYFEIILNINQEANAIAAEKIKTGSICNRRT